MKLIGYGLCLNGGRATQSTAALATSQVMLGMGSFTVVGARVGSQVSNHIPCGTMTNNLVVGAWY